MANRQKLGGAKDAVDDLVMLDQVKDDEIIKNLRNRYASDQIYTNIGPVLVAINPFKMIPRLFTEAKIREYRGKKFYEMPPHVYALADDAYRKMLGFHENQCIIISGESGSGKTETSKLIMQYISSVSGKSAEVQRVKDRMLSSNPLLEAFGNAKTVNNNNSSRFGKYMEILFDFGGDPVGGRVTNYLLEKSRVVGPAMNERNFHVFYQITMGASDAEREQYCLYGPEAYWYLSQSQCLTVDGIDDIKDFKEMTDAMVVMGLTEQDRAEVFRVISSILWLGNLQFEENHNEESKVSDPQVLEICAALLQVQSAALEKSICTRMIQTGAGARTENFCKPLPAKQASFSRDTLAKALYSRMFDWLVARVNDSIKKPDFKGVMIGVLDIYGFEIFQFNSFEQLCINFVNERLQQIFIELTLKAEQDEYRSEGIPWQEVEYYNNKPLCDLIESTPGLLSIMDDCCNTAKTDQMFVQDVGRYFSGNQAIFCGSNDFSIRHYAGDVRYEAEGFLQKNKDTLFDDLIQVIQSSPCQFVRDHGWAEIQVSTGQKKRPVTVGFAFKQQVQALMAALKACEPHYIRCIKPNMQKTPNNFNDANIKRQVQYLGLLENIRVRRAGYATRHPYATFVKRYKLLSRDVLAKRVHGDERVLCQAILSGIGFREGQEYAMGRTKVFIRHATAVFHLEDMIERKMNEAVIVIQKAYRKYKKKRYYLEMRAKAYDVVNNRKERRRGSIKMDYRGDYLNFTYNNLVGGLLQATGKREKVVFADRAKNIILRGKRSFFERIASAFKTEDQFEHRFLLLSDEALYSLTFLQDPQTNKTKVELYFRIPYNQIQSVTVSPYQDNFVIIHFAPSAGKTDILASVRHKTELLGLLVHNFKLKTNGQLNVQFLQTDSISVGDNKLVVVTWVKDELANEEKLMPVKHNVEIHICSGVPPSQVPAPFRPAEIDSSVPARPSLRALYDFKGNGVDELSFKKDDIIFVIAEEDGGWYNGELNGQKGFVPSNYVERIQRQAVAKPQPAAAAKPPPPAAALPVKCDWQELTTDDGMVYYWNNVSGESRWEKPAEMVAFERTHKPSISKPTVVAPQVQKCSAPGCSNDVFGGKNVCITHAKKEEKQPVAVAQPQVKVQAAVIKPQIQAAPVAAVANKPPAPATPAPSRTGFGTVQPRGPAAAAAVAQARPAMPAAAGARPEMKMVMPAAAAQPRPSPTAQQTPLSPRSAAAAAVARPAQVAQPQAQPGGFRLPVANQQPAAAVARPVAAATPARPAQAFKPPVPAAQPKKSAWTAQYDPASGATYYYNTETGASQWEKPADM